MSEPVENIFQLGEALEQRLLKLEEDLDDQVNKILDISRIGTALTSFLNLDLVLPTVIETALRLVKGEVGEVLVFDYQGRPKSISWGLNTRIISKISTAEDDNLIEAVKTSGETLVLNNLEFKIDGVVDEVAININSIIIAPLKSHQKILGVITIANKENDAEFGSEDILSLEMIGSFAAVAIRNSELHREALAKQKLESELEIAEHVQSTLLPDKKIEKDDLTAYAYYNMAGQVGGDFYDFIEIDKGKYLVVIADVSNKGIPAALIMTSVRSYVRVFADRMTSLADLAMKVNRHLSRDMARLGGMFVTMFFGLFDLNKHILYSVNAGHPPGYLFNQGKAIKLKTGGTFIGQFPELKFVEMETPLNPGDRLIVFTDGMFECTNLSGEMLGLEKAYQFFVRYHHTGWNNFSRELRKLMLEYSSDQGRVDDTTLLMIEVRK